MKPVYYHTRPKVVCAPPRSGLMELSSDALQGGDISATSEWYEYIVPRTALMGDGYVYLTVPGESYIGTVYTLARSYVTVLNMNDYECAVKPDAFFAGGAIVTDWDRAISDGDSVIVLTGREW